MVPALELFSTSLLVWSLTVSLYIQCYWLTVYVLTLGDSYCAWLDFSVWSMSVITVYHSCTCCTGGLKHCSYPHLANMPIVSEDGFSATWTHYISKWEKKSIKNDSQLQCIKHGQFIQKFCIYPCLNSTFNQLVFSSSYCYCYCLVLFICLELLKHCATPRSCILLT